MDNTKRLMVMEFSRYVLWHNTGFPKEVFIKILEQLPANTEIRGFAERPERDVYSILLSNESFTEVSEAQPYPRIIAIITNPGQIVTLDWPEEYKANHECQYKIYQGFAKTEEICTVCGKVK